MAKNNESKTANYKTSESFLFDSLKLNKDIGKYKSRNTFLQVFTYIV